MNRLTGVRLVVLYALVVALASVLATAIQNVMQGSPF